MKTFYTSIKALLFIGLVMIGGSAFGQIKVNYNAIPDFDKVPPVAPELGIPGGNAKGNSNGVARSKSVAANNDELPTHWNNSLFKHFPPFFNQSGPSCMGSSFVGYIFTHELNSYRNLEGSNPQNQMAIFFSWLQTYQNTDKEEFEIYNGCPNAVDYEGRTNSEVMGYYDWRSPHAGWMQGYDKWHRAMYNRATGHYTFPLSLAKEDGRLAAKRWLYNHNGDTDFKSGGLCYVTLAASGMTQDYVAETPANLESGAAGKQYLKRWGKSIDHAMTLIGWDDRVEFDLNENGIYGEEQYDEKGAWIVANSWGAGWSNSGWIYVPYRLGGPVGNVIGNYFWQPYVTYIRKDYTPQRTIKLLMDYTHRNELYLSVGVSPDTTAKSPAFTTPMSAFKNAGNGAEGGGYPEVPMLGKYVDGMHHEPMEFGYDLTDISNGYDPSKPLKYFFSVKVSNGEGTGHIYKASIMDYRYETEDGMEIPFEIDTVIIGKGAKSTTTVISVVVPGEAINAPLNTSLTGKQLKWDAPAAASIKLKKYYIYRDNILCDSVLSNHTTYTVSDPQGAYCVSAVYGYKDRQIESVRGNMAYQERIMPEGDNKSLLLSNGQMVVPNAIPNRSNEATIEFWVKPTEIGPTPQRICGSKTDKFFFEITPSGQLTAGWGEEDRVSTSARFIKANTWQHVAISIQSNTITLFVNGMKKGSFSSKIYSGLPELGDLLIGTEDRPFNSEIDELRIWKSARAQADIYASKDQPVAVPSAQLDLIGYLPMNLIEFEGEQRVEEFVCHNHAYLLNNYTSKTETSIMKGGSFSVKPSIGLGDSIYVNQQYQFKGVGGVNIIDWTWNTPGATVETHKLQSPYVTYVKPGTYNISMTATDTKGTITTIEKEVTVTSGTLPAPDFKSSATRLATAAPFSFINLTKTPNCTFEWTIDDNEKIHLTNFNKAFNESGTHTVTLTATNSAGSASVTKTVEVYKARPASKFNIAPNEIILGEKTYLEDQSTGEPTSWIWTLTNSKRYLQVDGQFSSLVPTAPGYYDVSLQTANSEGANISTKKRALCVSNADAKNGLVFAGNGEMLEINRPFAENQKTFTIEWWMNPSAAAGAGAFKFGDLETVGDGDNYYNLIFQGRNSYVRSASVTNQWHHYALVFNNGTIGYYRDGEELIERTWAVDSPIAWPEKLNFGRSENPFGGYIDELRIWDSALSVAQLKAVCNQPIENPADMEHLCVYYDFNQNGGDVIDRTGHGYDAKRVNFGPDGDAWIVSPGVFTLDFEEDVIATDVTADYLTNYKKPFLATGPAIKVYARGIRELLSETETSTWIKDAPIKQNTGYDNTIYVDSIYGDELIATSYYYYGMDHMYDYRLYQTVTLPQGHYRFKFNVGRATTPGYTRLVACYGDTLVNNASLNEALASCTLSNQKEIEFDVNEDNTNVSLGLIFNLGEGNSISASSFSLYRISSTTQIADGVSDAYDAVKKGKLGTYSAEVGAIRIVSPEIIEAKIYDAQGRCVFNEYVSGNHRIPLQPGIYVVDGQKLLVK